MLEKRWLKLALQAIRGVLWLVGGECPPPFPPGISNLLPPARLLTAAAASLKVGHLKWAEHNPRPYRFG